MTWDLSFKSTVVHVPLWPALLALAGVLVAVVAAALIRQAIGGAGGPGNLGPKRVYFLFALVPTELLIITPWVHVSGLFADAAEHECALFRGPVLAELVVATLGAAALASALSWLAALPPAAPARVFAPAAWAGALLAQGALLHAGALLTLDRQLPVLAFVEPVIVQVGRSANLTPQLVEVFPGSRPMERTFKGWTAAPVVVTGDRQGSSEVTLRAQRSGLLRLTMTARVPIRIAEERGDARFPLRVGNRWRYEVTRSSKVGGLVKLLGAEGSRDVKGLQIRVEAPVMIAGGGVRAFWLTLEGEPRGEVQVYAADGELISLDKDGSQHPLLAARSGAGTLESSTAAPGFSLFQGAPCSFGSVGPLSGPTGCQKQFSVNTGLQLGIGLLTAGIAAPGDTTLAWNLVETEAGPADAPAVVSSR